MIVELRKYNEIGELLLEIGTTGLQGQVCYWDRGWRLSVTMVAVCMGKEETGMRTGQGQIQSTSESGMREGTH